MQRNARIHIQERVRPRLRISVPLMQQNCPWMANYIQTGQVRRVHNVVKRLTSNRLEVDQFQILKTTGACEKKV